MPVKMLKVKEPKQEKQVACAIQIISVVPTAAGFIQGQELITALRIAHASLQSQQDSFKECSTALQLHKFAGILNSSRHMPFPALLHLPVYKMAESCTVQCCIAYGPQISKMQCDGLGLISPA